MAATGFTTSYNGNYPVGTDLASLFQSGNSGIVTNYKNPQGQDLGSVFAPYTSGTKANLTGYNTNIPSNVNLLYTANGATFEDIKISSDGLKIIACYNNNYIFLSTDSGVTWNTLTAFGSRQWGGVSASDDFNTILAGTSTGSLEAAVYLSTNSGNNVTPYIISSSTNYDAVVVSPDGGLIATAAGGSYIYNYNLN